MKISGIEVTHTTKLQKLSNISLLLSPILNIYGWSSISFALLVNAFIFLLYILDKIIFSKKLITKKTPVILIIYLLYWFITNAIHADSIKSIAHTGIIFTSFYVIYSFELFKFDYFVKYYRILAFIFIIFYIFQVVVLNLNGVLIKGVTDLLPISFIEGDLEVWYMNNEIGMRPSSFFSEPAHMAQFLLPLLSIELFSTYKDLRRAIVLIITLIILQSGNGYVGLGVIIIFYIISVLQRSKYKNMRKKAILLLIISSLCLMYFINTEKGEKVLARSSTLFDYTNSNGNSWDNTSSAFIRIYRSFYVYDKFSCEQKIFGIGNNNNLLSDAQKKSKISYLFDDNDTYMSGLQSFLIKSGVLGLSLFLLFSLKLFNTSNYLGKCLISTMLIIMCIASMYFQPMMLTSLLISWNNKIK